MDQSSFVSGSEPITGSRSGPATGLEDPVAWFARALIDASGLDAAAGPELAGHIETIAAALLSSDPATQGRLSRHDAVSMLQAVRTQIAHLEAVQAYVAASLTLDAAYHGCDDDRAADDGSGHPCPTCTAAESSDDDPSRDGGSMHGHSGWSPSESPVGRVGMELSPALGVSPTFATNLVDEAVDLVSELPATWSAMAAGRVDAYRARIIAAGTRPLVDNVDVSLPEPQRLAEADRRERLRASIEARVLDRAAERTGEQLRRQVRRLVLRADPSLAQAARRHGVADRRVGQPSTRGDDAAAMGGIGSMTVHGPIEDLHALHVAVDAAARHARTVDGDPRSLDQLRFDILTGIGWSALRDGHIGPSNDAPRLAATTGRRPVQVRVTVSLATLLGLDEDPADLAGLGPIPAAVATELAFSDDATWRRMVTDPLTGALLDYGHTAYRPPAALDAHVRARDGTSRFPTAITSSDHADLDHTDPYRHGPDGRTADHTCIGAACRDPRGRTADDNLGSLTRRAHNARTHHHWTLQQPEPGRFHWTSPAKHHYTVEPDPLEQPDPGTLVTEARTEDPLLVLRTAGVTADSTDSTDEPPF